MDLSFSALAPRLDQPDTLAASHDITSPPGFRNAAVIVPLIAREDGLRLIFNKRAAHLDAHAAQVSFPGGRYDPGDVDLLATACRELEEELGIPPPQHRPLCRLPARLVISYFQITPFVSLIAPEAQIQPDPGEVAYVFEVPLAHFTSPKTLRTTQGDVFGQPCVFYNWEYGGETIWGATGRILADFLRLLGVGHLEA